MKTYRTPGATATEWSPNGAPQTVTRLETIEVADTIGNTQTVAVPVMFSLKGETSRKGIRRVVLRGEGSIPKGILTSAGAAGFTGDAPVSAHLVVQGPEMILRHEAGSNLTAGVHALLAKLIQDIVAVVSNESTTASSDLVDPVGIIGQALAGNLALDVVSGSYGESTARS